MLTFETALAESKSAPARRGPPVGDSDGNTGQQALRVAHSPAPGFEGEPAPGLRALAAGWMEQMLDQVDYGMLLVTRGGGLVYANAAARAALGASHPLKLECGNVRARTAQDGAPLVRAFDAAARRGLRSLVTLRGAATPVCAAVIPLRVSGASEESAALVILGRQSMSEELSAHWFGRCNGLTPAESQVLRLLRDGLLPSEVAGRQGVAESTIRTQIVRIREKTGAPSIRALLCQLAVLPPLVSILR